jgi:hypothetical protein
MTDTIYKYTYLAGGVTTSGQTTTSAANITTPDFNTSPYNLPSFRIVGIIFGTSCTSVANNAFNASFGYPITFTELVFSSTITSIGMNAFYASIRNLTTLVLPPNIISYGMTCFGYFNTNVNNGSIIFENATVTLTQPSNNSQDIFFSGEDPPANLNIHVTCYNTADASAVSAGVNYMLASVYQGGNPTYISGGSCFQEGTQILCKNMNHNDENEKEYIYRNIECLKKGDVVKSYLHGDKKISMIGKGRGCNSAGCWNTNMYIMKKTDSNELTNDIVLTGGHGILTSCIPSEIEEKNKTMFKDIVPKIDDKVLLLVAALPDFQELDSGHQHVYYHFVLEADENDDSDNARYGVWSNGLLTETPSKLQFLEHNYEIIE